MRKRIMAAAVGTALMSVTLTGCGGTNDKRDLEGISSFDPDYAEVYNNTDGRPNVALLCIRGVGFASTTRDFSSLTRVKEWDTFCSEFPAHATVEKQMRKNG